MLVPVAEVMLKPVLPPDAAALRSALAAESRETDGALVLLPLPPVETRPVWLLDRGRALEGRPSCNLRSFPVVVVWLPPASVTGTPTALVALCERERGCPLAPTSW